jgi:hypothetical protein
LLLIVQAKALPSVIDDASREAYMGRVACSLPFMLSFMPQETLQWRLHHWLDVGCARLATTTAAAATTTTTTTTPSSGSMGTNNPYAQLQNLRTLVIAGELDHALPSIAEAEQLVRRIPNAVVHVVNGAGHASTCGSRVDLAALFRAHYFFHPELVVRKNPVKRLPPPTTTTTTTTSETGNVFSFWPPQFKSKHSADRSADETWNMGNRTAMKEEAANGIGAYFGMQPRYDHAKIGLSPFQYWNEKYYRQHRTSK